MIDNEELLQDGHGNNRLDKKIVEALYQTVSKNFNIDLSESGEKLKVHYDKISEMFVDSLKGLGVEESTLTKLKEKMSVTKEDEKEFLKTDLATLFKILNDDNKAKETSRYYTDTMLKHFKPLDMTDTSKEKTFKHKMRDNISEIEKLKALPTSQMTDKEKVDLLLTRLDLEQQMKELSETVKHWRVANQDILVATDKGKKKLVRNDISFDDDIAKQRNGYLKDLYNDLSVDKKMESYTQKASKEVSQAKLKKQVRFNDSVEVREFSPSH